MDALLNVTSLFQVLMDHRDNIRNLEFDKRMQFAQMLLAISNTCERITINVRNGVSIAPQIQEMRDNQKLIADGIALFAKRSFADKVSNLFDVKTNIDTYLSLCDATQKEKFGQEFGDAASNYKVFIEACLAM